MICPDCFKARVSQLIKLQNNYCPDCGGRYKNNKWISAPSYPQDNIEYTNLMGIKRISRAVKSDGIWRNREALRVG